MFSKTLINLIDFAIFPAILIVASKILSIVFLTRYFNAEYSVEGLKLVFNNAENFIAINSYSSLFMYAAVLGGLIWVLIKAHVFHDTHVTPTLSSQLVNMNMEELVDSTKTIYSQAFVWLSYSWLTTVVYGVQSYFGLSYWWVFIVSLVASVIATAMVVVDMEKEIQHDMAQELEMANPKLSVLTLKDVRKQINGK
jgi:hypothetical protein